MKKQPRPNQPTPADDPARLIEAIERGEQPEGVEIEKAAPTERRLDQRRSKYQLGQLNANV